MLAVDVTILEAIAMILLRRKKYSSHKSTKPRNPEATATQGLQDQKPQTDRGAKQLQNWTLLVDRWSRSLLIK